MSIARNVGSMALALALAACNGSSNPFVGSYEIDHVAMGELAKQNMPKTDAAPSTVAATQPSMSGTLDIHPDATLEIDLKVPIRGEIVDTGTWVVDGSTLEITTSDKRVLRGTLDGDRLTCMPAGGEGRMQLIWKRK